MAQVRGLDTRDRVRGLPGGLSWRGADRRGIVQGANSPWWIYFEPEGLALYFADDSALQFAVRERNTAYRNAVIAYEKAGSVEDWIKKKEYLDLQIEAVQSVLD